MGAKFHPNAINKGEFSGNDVTCDKNLALAHRPIPGLVERVVSKQKHFPEVISKKPNTLADVEESEDDNNVMVLMFVRHTEAFLDEIDRMDVDEMVDIEDPISQ